MKFFNPTSLALIQQDITEILKPIEQMLDLIATPLLYLVGAVGSIWCIILGVKFAKAEDPQEHEKAKKALINAIIGFVLIFVLLIMLDVALPKLILWWQNFGTELA